MKIKTNLSAMTILLMLCVILMPTLVEKANASSSRGGIWHLDEGTGTTAYDSSGNGNQGTVYGAIWTDGKIGKALEFDGVNDYVNVPDSNSLDVTGKITMEAWIYPHTVSKVQVIVQKYNYSGPPYNGAYYLGIGGYGYNNKVLVGLSHNGYNFYYTLSNTNITANTWTHVAATSNGTHMCIYINGIKDKAAAYPPGVIYASTAPLRIGCFLPELGQSRFFDGIIDEVRVAAGTIWTVDDDRVQCPNADFTSVQAAIDKASSGDTIIVHAGTYNEALYIKKSLTIRAASTPVIKGGQLRATNYGNRQATIFVEDANNVMLEGFDVEGQGLGVPSGTKSYAIVYENSSGIIRDCIVSPNTIGDMYCAAIAAWDNSDVTIKHCMIQNFGRIGIYSNNATLAVQDNTIIGQVYSSNDKVNYGIEIEDYTGPSVAEIANNEIYDCDNTHPSPLWSSCAIIVDIWRGWYDLLPSAVTIENNDIHHNFEAIEIISNSLSYAHYNDISNNRYGVWVDPDLYNNYAMFDARFNWWGDASGPNQIATNPTGLGNDAGDYADYSPWLGATFDTTPRTYHVNPTGTIQEAIDEASSGDTVVVHSGTYREALYISKSITLEAAETSSIIEAPGTIPQRSFTGPSGTQKTRPIMFVYGAVYVTVEGFVIDGRGVGNTNYGLIGIQYFEASGMIKDNTIRAVRNTPLDGAQHGVGIVVNHLWDQYCTHSVEIFGNTIFDYQKGGIVCNEPGTTATVTYNTLTGFGPTPLIAQNGIQFGWNATGAIEHNDVSGHIYTLYPTWSSAGILLYQYSNCTLIRYNDIHDNQIGIDIYQSSDVVVQYNNIYGNTEYGVYNTPSPIVDARNNWWGHATGPYHPTINPKGLGDTVSDDVDFIPWLPLVHDIAVIDVTASPTTVLVGETVTIEVKVENQGSDYENFTVTAYYDSTAIASQDVIKLLPNWNTTLTFYWNTTGMPRGNYTIKAEASNVPGETDLADNVLVDGKVQVLWHDVAVVDVVCNRTWVYQGHSVGISVTVRNEGDYPETVTVTLYYDIIADKEIGTQVISLTAGETRTIIFVWNTVGVEYCHNYTITAVASIAYPDADPADNTLVDGNVKVRILGDINGDGKVDLDDVLTEALSFGSFPGHPAWNPMADINRDDKVDLGDFLSTVLNFGKTCSP